MTEQRRYQFIADKIKNLIDDGTYPPGSRLPAERDLAIMFKASRVAVREAQIALQAIGRIQVKTGSGAYVLAPPSPEESGLPDVNAFELTEARALFEGEAVALAALQADDATITQLEGYIKKMADADPDGEDGEAADRSFHQAIARASGNPMISHVIDILWKVRTEHPAVAAAYKSVCTTDADARVREHATILSAIRARNPSAARIAMRNHFARLLESILDVAERSALDELRRKTSESRERYLKSASI